ncbi:MAG: hypothetical protein COV02_00640 [Candidatus Terrybacteria bacterium CG10_big_fil_rev_8_21_14_0_10_41_10]|uniref:Uncharacterized protein n=1 Tax=Candidatus Terrybacteria bacterium CG10_big_fil_rev_8_21_14_0_10_41_10 TaxID=1975026 RepID=A0A2M8LAY7_9BACT|nr:MAG: hypothetical protein COV02_00640 [Candidatus Terrybacteria bacterium CG10_big_fil_rev_8_21_14_0_10_41_10]
MSKKENRASLNLIEEYFKKSPDERSLAFERFNFGIFDSLGEIFSNSPLAIIFRLNGKFKA